MSQETPIGGVVGDTHVDKPADEQHPVEVTRDMTGFNEAMEKAPSPFVTDKATANEDLKTEESEKEADESGPKEEDAKESHLHQAATYYPAENTYVLGAIESEFDDGTVDIQTALGAFRRIPLQTGDEDRGYPRVELGTKED